MANNIRVTVLGDGGWGTALALVNLRRGNEVMIWSAFADYAAVLKEEHENIKFLPGVKLPKDLKITSSLKEAVDFGDVLVLAIPSQYLRNVLFKIKEFSYRGKIGSTKRRQRGHQLEYPFCSYIIVSHNIL